MRPLLLFLLFLFKFTRQIEEPPNDDYFSIGAHLNGDAFAKQLRRWVDNRLAIDQFKDHVSEQQWITTSFGLHHLRNLSSAVDTRLSSALSSLPALAQPMSSSFVSCHSIHELVRLPTSEPCAIRVSDTGKPPKFELKPSNDSLLIRQFLLSEDIQFEFPAEFLPPRIHSGPILSSLLPYDKTIVLVIDIGSLISQDHLDTVRLVTTQLLDIASSNDSFSIFVAKGGDLRQLGCAFLTRRVGRWSLAEAKRSLNDIQLEDHPIPTKHSKVLEKAVKELEGLKDSSAVLMYLSRGLLEDLEEAPTTVKRLSTATSQLDCPVKINTLLLIDERRSVPIWSSQFMENIARQNMTKGALGENKNFIEGEAISVEKNVLLDVNVVEKLLHVPHRTADPKRIAVSIPLSGSRHLSVSRKVSVNASHSVIGAEISLPVLMSDIFEDIHIRNSEVKVHLVTIDGLIILSSAGWEDVLLSSVEDWQPSSGWLLNDWERADAGDFEVRRKTDNRTLFYLWAKLTAVPLAIVVKSETPFPQQRKTMFPLKRMSSSLGNLIWHEYTKDSPSICSYFGTPVLPGSAALFLSSKVSKNPIDAPAAHWVFLTDRMGLIQSSGLRPGIREQVALLNSLVNLWVANVDGPGVLRKFAATPSGVLVLFPGTVVVKNFDPAKQQWFVESANKPNSIVITGPTVSHHLGDVVTVSIAITNNSSEIVAVLGLETTSSYLGKLVTDSIPICVNSRRCLLFSSRGTVLYSDKAYGVSEVVERFHISHLEPLLMSDMTSNERLVKKTLCRQGTSSRRQFLWDIRYSRVHTTPCGDMRRGGAVASEVLVVPGTQIFLAMINVTCARMPVTVFCPCSVHDGRCLFCGRFDSSECECPCTCPGCVDKGISVCEAAPREDRMTALSTASETPLCTKTDCTSLLHRDVCVSSPGCEWCRFSSHLDPLSNPRCASASICYHSVLGRHTSSFGERVPAPGWLTPAPIGPIAAGAMVLLFILIGFVYCFRNHLTRAVLTRRCTAVDSAPLFGVTLDPDCDPTVFKEERVSVQLAFFERETAARRPAPASDHGYSTMTDRNEETTSAVSTCVTDQVSSTAPNKPSVRILEPPPLMTSLVTMAEVHAEPRQMIC